MMTGCATSVIPTSYIAHPEAQGAHGARLCWVKPEVDLNSYENILVQDFATDEAVGMTPGVKPDMLRTKLRDLLIAELKAHGKNAVSDKLELPKDVPYLVISGKCAQLNPGERAMRYMVGFGAGRALVDVEAKASSTENEQTTLVAEFGVTATKSMGVWGGSSDKFFDDCLRRVARVITQNVVRQ